MQRFCARCSTATAAARTEYKRSQIQLATLLTTGLELDGPNKQKVMICFD